MTPTEIEKMVREIIDEQKTLDAIIEQSKF